MVDAKDRKHFAAIAAAMSADADARADEAEQLTPLQRMVLGLELGAAMPLDEAAEAELDRRALGQAELHMMWRRLQRRRSQRGPA